MNEDHKNCSGCGGDCACAMAGGGIEPNESASGRARVYFEGNTAKHRGAIAETVRRLEPAAEVAWDENALDRAFLVCHGDEAAGLMLGKETDGALDIALDYSTPTYRDSSEGRYLLEHLPNEGLKLLRYEHAEEGHVGYLKKMGYEQKGGAWERAL